VTDSFTGTRRYVVRRELGTGAVGRVYEAWDTQRRCEVALKTLVHLSPRALYRFKAEFRALADIRHDNLAALESLVVEGDTWFIVMELVRGADWTTWTRGPEGTRLDLIDDTTFLSMDSMPQLEALPSHLEPDGRTNAPAASPPPDIDRVRDATVQLLRGVDALHRHGKLHRDIKPSNLIVTRSGRVVLLDFGLVYDADRPASELSRVDKVVGTAAFMAPETALGEAPTGAADLYAVGVVLFLALTGQLPFEGSMVEMLSAKQVRDAPAPGALVHGLPPDVEGLCTQLLARDPSERPSAAEALRQLGEARRAEGVSKAPGLLGRETERQALEEAWARARAGRAIAMTVTAPAGNGTTALVRAFLSEVKRFEDVWILRGRCHDRESVPFQAIDALMDSLRRKLARLPDAERRTLDPGDVDALVSLFPVLGEVLDAESTEPGPAPGFEAVAGRAHRDAAIEAGGRLLRRLVRARPIIVYLDDVQWGDVGSARFLSRWMAELARSRLLVLLVGQPEGPLLGALQSDPLWMRMETRSLTVGLLDATSTAALVRPVIEQRVAPSEVEGPIRWVVRESRGHPALALELARAFEEGALATGAQDPDALKTLSFEDFFTHRLEALERPTQEVLFAVALYGRPIPTAAVAKVLGRDTVDDALTTLTDQRMLQTRRFGAVQLVELIHPRIAKTVIGREPPAARARMHLDLAETLRGTGWADPHTLLQHTLAAGAHDRVVKLATLAGDDAVARFDFDQAVPLYRTALDYAVEHEPAERQALIRETLAEAIALAGRGREAAELFEELAQAASGTQRLTFLRKAAEQALYAGHVERGVTLFEDVLAGLSLPPLSQDPQTLGARAGRVWADVRRGLGLGWSGSARLERIDAAHALGVALQLFDPWRARAYHLLALREAEAARDGLRIARSRCLDVAWQARSAAPRRDREKAVTALRTTVAEHKDPRLVGLLAVGEGVAAYLDGSFRTAMRVLSGAERHLAQTADPFGGAFELTVARLFRIRSLVYTGQLREARRIRERTLADALERGNELLVRSLRGDILALLELAADDADAVKRHVVDQIESWSGGRWPIPRMFAYRAEALRLLYAGRPVAALEVTDRMLETLPGLARHVQLTYHTDFLRGRVLVARAQQAEASDPQRADWLVEAHRRADRVGQVADTGHRVASGFASLLRAAIARAEHPRGPNDQAVSHLDAAILALDRAELVLFLQIARRARAVELGDARERDAAEGWMRHEGIVDPARFAGLYLPGFGE
jgi:hypothetical protein